jgi:hypothetical protein
MHSLSLLLALVSALLSLGAAALYFPARQFKPYHAVVSGREWSALEPGVQTIIRGMLRIVASGFLACGLALLFLLLPLNRGEVWASWASLAVGFATWLPALFVTFMLKRAAPSARPPTALISVILAFVAAAFVSSMLAHWQSSGGT